MKMMKRWLAAAAAVLFVAPIAKADEGMWMVQFLKQQNLAKMQAMGMQMSAEDIYNPGKGSLVDAVVQFGGGCTGEIISSQGLVITNHHCGFGEIQNHSSVDHNYLRDGFYAPTLQSELPNPGLTVTIVEEIVDATDYLNSYIKAKGITDPLQYMRRAFLRKVAEQWYKENRGELTNGVNLDMAPFYEGNRYYLFVKKIYSDIRLVAAPPSCIGKFGADTDNWAWPRHSGDFSVFRIYTAPDGSPAEYAAENIPLNPKYYLKINSSGVQEDDFVMMMGFPGTTNHFYTPSEVVERRDIDNQIRIDLRKVRQETMWEEMMKDEAVNIQYAAKYQGSTNAYKNAIGTNWATNKMDFEGNKRAMVDKLRAYAKKVGKPEYSQAIDKIESMVAERAKLRALSKIYDEGLNRAVETMRAPLLTEKEFANTEPDKFMKQLDNYFNKDYNIAVDKKVTKAMLTAVLDYIQKVQGTETLPVELAAPAIAKALLERGELDKVFDNSLYQNREKLQQILKGKTYNDYASDPLVALAMATHNDIATISKALAEYDRDFAFARKTMLQGMLEMEGEMNLWPDANLTLRYTFGRVKGYSPRDNVYYGHQTTMEGIMEKRDDNSPEFYLLPKVIEIYKAKDFGKLALANGKMPVDFISTTHSTGGNSGSPLVNGRGELVGINFDRNWEGVGGDIQYLPDYQRSIIVDARYLLLVLDKYLGAQRLLDEIDIVE
ncbi:S46 family peptidase [Porphyromonas levii]|uniref:S46 family peptidase n=1 Tax=Porphyromonas levii TaxID=28114 RepID=UPI001D7AEF43|nr:Asp/Glu-specific dipeptidyl-peptidase [Porphyromonas levii]MBR8715527.1 Asp/Glu-specific dipeptidyl-peptidase [Porphyromonas levii]MBR8728063.1 Asp/Glu-specific dipeptidyl-peptidase [Porphyromonas levii]MBR8736403.1 Asp/Glu-specific dipeptidyl-peptidase [Porphyromonas levii]MBR8778418.1 Asp/Glu-specific dipeptidyl-peptidase [Porphyromonas levii]